MQAKKAFFLAIIAGIVGGALSAAINLTIVRAQQGKIADFYVDEFVAPGIIDEGEFNQELQLLQLQNVALPIAVGVGGGVLVAAVYLRIGTSAFKMALAVAGAAWLALYVIPALRYPANPDTAFNTGGDSGYSVLYAGYTAASGFAALGSAIAFSRTRRKNWYIGAAGVYTGIIGALYFLFPAFSGLEFVPPQLLTGWRSSMAASMTALWFTLGIVAGALLEREEKKKGAGRGI